MRTAGILMPITSSLLLTGLEHWDSVRVILYNFTSCRTDILADTSDMSNRIWDSPYQSFSSYAGNPYMIDFDDLKKKDYYRKKNMLLFPGVIIQQE